MKRWRDHPRIDAASAWVVANAPRIWAVVLVAIVLALSWHSLRGIHTREVRAVLRSLDSRPLTIAAVVTVINIAIMGLYDVMAFAETRTRAMQRWKFGAVAFCWSNFLTLGPLAGPAIRFWLYRRSVAELSELHTGIVSVVIAFVSGLAGWTAAALIAPRVGGGIPLFVFLALVFVIAAAWCGRAIARRTDRFEGRAAAPSRTFEMALVGWLDWLLGAIVFVLCLHATGRPAPTLDLLAEFFTGQVIGLASLVPGGFGSSDAFWIARLPFDQNVSAAGLGAFRLIYYVAPWFIASIVLLSWATRMSSRRIDVARRITASLVAAGGILMILSTASPAIHARVVLMERYLPLPLVEFGQLAAALAGLILLVLARGLARGYASAYKFTIALLLLGGFASLLKGLDWEEAAILGAIGAAAWSQSSLFDRASGGDWLDWGDLAIGFAALLVFVLFGTFSHHIEFGALERWTSIGYRLQAARFLRTAASMGVVVGAATLYVLIRTPVRFEPPTDEEIQQTLNAHAGYGTGTTPIMVAVGDKSVFFDGRRGFCLYRTIGPYLAVFSDPMVTASSERAAFLNGLFTFAANIDRRPLFYQISLDWIPLLHDRGYHLFKLGEEAHVRLDRLTLEGHAGKLTRQILRRAERDAITFRVMHPPEIANRIDELADISSGWLRAKEVTERQFSIGYFDADYIRRFPCAVVETRGGQRLLAFANLLEGPRHEELSVDLMRYRTDGPSVMDFLLLSTMLHGKSEGYHTFNLGMAPLASVGEHRGARIGERLAGLLFRRGDHWYNFQGVRFYKQKFDPEWVPRYMAYQSAVEWPVALANVSALIAGSWGSALLPGRESAKAHARIAWRHLAISLLFVLTACGCAAHTAPAGPDQFVSLNSHSLRLRLQSPDRAATHPLLVYATGDGGMHRKDLDTYRQLAALGYPIVGFDARDYVKHLGPDTSTTTPERLAHDYSQIIARAREVLGLDAHCSVVLVGVSRGAGLAVVAAGPLRDSITGVVAVALTQEEEYIRWYRDPAPHETRSPVMVDVYEYLGQLGNLPIAVVQSTHDSYLPAAKAREQFGPDTPYRWLQPIDAASHNFGGARTRMYDAVRSALDWVVTPRRNR